jgi:hypothetical protein
MSDHPFISHPVSIEHRDGDTLITAAFDYGEGESAVHASIRGRVTNPPVAGDVAFPIALVGAMCVNRPLKMSDPVSPKLLAASDRIQAMLHSWFPELETVPIEAGEAAGGETAGRGAARGHERPGTAHFFSGGVDSFYSVVERRDELDALVFVEGADLAAPAMALREEVAARLGDAASDLALPLLRVETNLSEWALQFGRHGNDFVGARLAFVAHLLGAEFREFIVAPSGSGRESAMSSDPLLDPLWSSEIVSIRHPVPLVTRAEKLRALAEQKTPLRHLRVCMGGTAYNCGGCPKCARTMLTLEVLGALERCPAFPGPFVLDRALESIARPGDLKATLHHVREPLALGREIGANPDLLEKLEHQARVLEGEILWREMGRAGDEFFERADWDRVSFDHRREWFRQLMARNPDWMQKEIKATLDDEHCESLFDLLWRSDRKWLVRRVSQARFDRLIGKLRRLLKPGRREG